MMVECTNGIEIVYVFINHVSPRNEPQIFLLKIEQSCMLILQRIVLHIRITGDRFV